MLFTLVRKSLSLKPKALSSLSSFLREDVTTLLKMYAASSGPVSDYGYDALGWKLYFLGHLATQSEQTHRLHATKHTPTKKPRKKKGDKHEEDGMELDLEEQVREGGGWRECVYLCVGCPRV